MLLTHTPDPEEVLMKAVAQCYNAEPSINAVRGCIKRGHTSTLEHVVFTFLVEDVSRAESHQHVRHRIASYTQQSQRYVNQGTDFAVMVPASIWNDEELSAMFCAEMERLEHLYGYFLSVGVPKEDARYILPNACTTQFVCTMNLRALMNFLELRLDKHAQWEIRKVAQEMWDLAKYHLPNLASVIEEAIGLVESPTA